MGALSVYEQQQDIIRICRNDPVRFVTRFLEAKPEPWQAEFLERIQKNNRIAVRSGHGVGKTTVLAWTILWALLFIYPIKIGVTAPSADQINDVLWQELRKWHRRLPDMLKDQLEILNDKVINKEHAGESFCSARTATKEKPEAMQGIHSENVFFIIDEAAGVDDQVFEVAMSSMSTKNGKIIMTGNPTNSSGYFYDAFNSNARLWSTMKVSSFDSSHSRHGTHIEEYRSKYGESSPQYRSRVLGEFPTADTFSLMPRALIELAIDRDAEPIDGPIIWGVDIARAGGDRSTLAKRKSNYLLEQVTSWEIADSMQTADRIAWEYNHCEVDERPQEIYVDGIGVGGPVADRLRQLGLPAIDCNVSESASSKADYVALRDELWWRTKEWFEARNCKIKDDPALINELCSVQWEPDAKGRIKIENKYQMRKRIGRSPDLADAFVMTMMNLATGKYEKWKPIPVVSGAWYL